jgi:hypothetical protein
MVSFAKIFADSTSFSSFSQLKMDEDLNEFRQSVKGKWTRIAFAMRLLKCLRFVAQHPNHILDIGVVSYQNNAILFDVRILSNFLELSRNGVTKNLRQHGFELEDNSNILQDLEQCAPGFIWTTKAKTWSKRVYHGGAFHSSMSDAEAFQVSECASAARITCATMASPTQQPELFTEVVKVDVPLGCLGADEDISPDDFESDE